MIILNIWTNIEMNKNTIYDICFICLQPLTMEQKRTGVCAEHSNGLLSEVEE